MAGFPQQGQPTLSARRAGRAQNGQHVVKHWPDEPPKGARESEQNNRKRKKMMDGTMPDKIVVPRHAYAQGRLACLAK